MVTAPASITPVGSLVRQLAQLDVQQAAEAWTRRPGQAGRQVELCRRRRGRR